MPVQALSPLSPPAALHQAAVQLGQAWASSHAQELSSGAPLQFAGRLCCQPMPPLGCLPVCALPGCLARPMCCMGCVVYGPMRCLLSAAPGPSLPLQGSEHAPQPQPHLQGHTDQAGQRLPVLRSGRV